MMENIKYSIIVPVYKAEKYIDRCIQSIILQTENSWELILVDDGSPDNSGAICDKYAQKDSRIKVIHNSNCGVSSARNCGIGKASGTWITFIDSDDWVDKTYLEDFGCANNACMSSIYVQGIGRNVPDGRILNDMFNYPRKSFLYNNIDDWQKYKILQNGCPVAKLFNKQLIIENNILFNHALSLNEDHIFVTDYYRYVDIIHLLPKVNYHYYYDFKVESQTKKFHSTEELLMISKFISESLYLLCARLGVPPSKLCTKDVHYIFGLKQIVAASLSSIQEPLSRKKFMLSAQEYQKNLNIQKISACDCYSHIFTFCISHDLFLIGYISAFIYYFYHHTYRFLINFTKKIILKR